MYNFAILGLGTTELLLILAIVLLLFGSKKLPELSKSLGQSIKELRSSVGSNKNEKNAAQQKQENSAS